MNRRSYCITLGSISLSSLSGCLGSLNRTTRSDEEPSLNGYIRPDEKPDAVDSDFACEDDEFEPLSEGYSEEHLHWGDTDDFSLRVNDLTFEYGETVEMQLSYGNTGNRHKWNFEVYTENGWQELRGTTDEDERFRVEYTDEGTDGGHEWSIELTESGIVEGSYHDDILHVCPDLVSGRYRFVYWGLTGDESVAVAFDLDA